MPTLRALECLVAVVDTGSVTAAAQRLHASQPAVSHQLAGLEHEVGVPLLDRLPRGVVPTSAGRRLADRARVALEAAAQGVADARDADTATVRVGCVESFTATLLPRALQAWWASVPDSRVALTEAVSADALVEALVRDEIDVAVTPPPTGAPGQQDRVGWEEVVVVTAHDHRLAAHDAVPLTVLADEPMLQLHPGNALATWVERHLAEAGVQPTVRLRTRQISALAPLAASGLGVAVVPRSAVPPGFTGVVRPCDPPLGREVLALRRSDADPVAARFVELLCRLGVPVPM